MSQRTRQCTVTGKRRTMAPHLVYRASPTIVNCTSTIQELHPVTNRTDMLYSASQLKSIGKLNPKERISEDLWRTLGNFVIRKPFRSKRGRKYSRHGPHTATTGHPVTTGFRSTASDDSSLPSPLSYPSMVESPSVTTVVTGIPTLLMCNLRSLCPKMDELECVVRHNGADIVSVTGTWLTQDIPDSAVSMRDFMILRSNRSGSRADGGVALFINSSIPSKMLPDAELLDASGSESLWVKLRPFRLPRSVSSILVEVIYHPSSVSSDDNSSLCNHIQETVDQYLLKHPEGFVYVTGDFNPTATKFSSVELKGRCGLTQTVRVPTRDTGTLDWCLTNRPRVLSEPVQLPKIGRSDHYSVLVNHLPRSRDDKPYNQTLPRRDMRTSCLREFGQWITTFSWDDLFKAKSCQAKFDIFQRTITKAMDKFCPVKPVKVHTSDKPWITNNIKFWIARRQKALSKFGKDSSVFKLWRNKVAKAVQKFKHSFYRTKVKTLKNTNIRRWWDEVKNLSGVKTRENQWNNHLIDGYYVGSVDTLCTRVNEFFVGLTSGFTPISPGDVADITASDVPQNLLASQYEAYKALRAVKTNKSPGPNGIPSTILKIFAFELAPVLVDLYNTSLREGFLPSSVKNAIFRPLPHYLKSRK